MILKSLNHWRLWVIPKVWEAKEIIYNAHTKHRSHLKIDSTYKEVLKSGFKWENIQVTQEIFTLSVWFEKQYYLNQEKRLC